MPLPNIPTGHWVELPDTNFKLFADATNLPKNFARGGVRTMFAAWTSGLVDRNRNRWVVPRPGGHADGPYNGVNAFSLATLTWSTLKQPETRAAVNYGDAGYPPMDGNATNNLYTPQRIRAYSNDPTDVRTATITGENTAGTVIVETIQLNGTTPVFTTTVYRWLQSLTMSAANVDNVRRAYFRYEDDSTGVWPITSIFPSDEAGASSSGVSRFQGPQLRGNPLGTSSYYASTPTVNSTTEPSSVHSYDSYAHLVAHDVYYSGGGIYFSPGGENNPNTVWIFNPNTNVFHLPSPGSTTRPGGGTSCVVWDPTLNLLWSRSSVGLHTYDYPTNTFTIRNTSTAGGTTNSKLVIDNEARKLYLITPNSGTSVTLYEYNIANPAAVTITPINPSGTIDVRREGSSTGTTQGLGAVWIGERLAVYGRDSTATKGAIYTVNPSAPVWNLHETPDGIAPPLPPPTGGIWNKFFTPDDIHLLYIGWQETDNVWAYKVPWSTATPFRPIGLNTVIR